ncbi:PPC domain-containing DNA-binding protein [Microbacterium sp.]|uniref:PPC domain-containing DNA-binding protein n=1 Tax=Microbacterium sp. TaxID=51671 RepID=UPI003A8C2C14
MRTTTVTTGRRILLALEPGDEVIESIAAACRQHDVRQGVIVTFSGAFRTARVIAADHRAPDPELPLTASVTAEYTEGVGSGTVTSDESGAHSVHIHVALGAKDRSGQAVAGHLLAAVTHYVTEVVVDEVLAPSLQRHPHPSSSTVPILTFAEEGASR